MKLKPYIEQGILFKAKSKKFKHNKVPSTLIRLILFISYQTSKSNI
jgi:hypothetical protein